MTKSNLYSFFLALSDELEAAVVDLEPDQYLIALLMVESL